MKILVTGSSGFIGKNLIAELEKRFGSGITVYTFNSSTPVEKLGEYAKDCDFVYHLAAIHRPKEECEFRQINYGLLETLVSELEKNNNSCPVLYTSSIQAGNGSEYGKSKIDAEELLATHAKKFNSRAIIYRLTNTFGRWARPNGHSVVATFCHNIQHGIPISVSNREHMMRFYYIEDVVNDFINRLNEKKPWDDSKIRELSPELTYNVTLGELADKLYEFKDCQVKGCAPLLLNDFDKKLYATFISYKN